MCIEKDVKLNERQKTLIKKVTNNQENMKLPKTWIDEIWWKYIFKWQKFWNSYEATIHNSNSLSNNDKFNYLRAQLISDARRGIFRLETTDSKYRVAIEILQERHGKEQLIINAHYEKLRNASVIYILRKGTSNIQQHWKTFTITLSSWREYWK